MELLPTDSDALDRVGPGNGICLRPDGKGSTTASRDLGSCRFLQGQ